MVPIRDWCDRVGFIAFPATPTVVGAFLASSSAGYAIATLRRRVAGIAGEARELGGSLDTLHPDIRQALRGLAKGVDDKPRKAAALVTKDVVRLAATRGASLADARDRAILLVGYAGALRRSELVGLDVGDLKWTDSGVTLHLRRSKADNASKGVDVSVARGQGPHCPVTALRTWLERAKITAGPVFRMVDRNGKVRASRLSADTVRTIVIKLAAAAGMTPTPGEPITAHGLRSGFVTEAVRSGVHDEEIMGHTRHKSHATMRGYVRRAKLSTKSPSSKLGL